LNSTAATPLRRTVWAVRWLSPGAPAPYTVLAKDRITLGRDDSADIILDASAVSREHALLTRQGPVYSLADVNSTNGTLVNGQPVSHVALDEGDVLRLGDMLGIVVRTPAATATGKASEVTTVAGALFGPGTAEQLQEIRNTARTTLPLVIVGETGVGKEAASKALHELSGRTGPFHAVNCAALPQALAEAELFGYRKGAFTGAVQAGLGHFRAADGGTLLLDELADLSPSIQAKLLRVIQESRVMPLGETKSVDIDVRLVAACQVPVEELVQRGRLREDLAMRLNGTQVLLPPLCERRLDVALLTELFLERWAAPGCRFEPRALERILLHDWPGNVRELEHVVRRSLAGREAEATIPRTALPATLHERTPASTPPPPGAAGVPISRADHDLERLVAALRENGHVLAEAARTSGISRQRAYRLLRGRTVDQVLRDHPDPSERS
jgi:transcriptional regulator with GAF, ATPase, and Fis domain